MHPTLRSYFAWTVIFSFWLNGLMLPAMATDGPSMEICRTSGERPQAQTKPAPLHGKQQHVCEHCSAASHSAAIPPTLILNMLGARVTATAGMQIAAAPYPNSAIDNFLARAPPRASGTVQPK